MTHLQTSLLAVVLALTLLNVAVTRQAVRPVSSCEWQSIAALKLPLKGSIPLDTATRLPPPPTPEEIEASVDWRTE